ncbi:MAG: hypothetical protein J5818_00790 [Eggerthellaceae bacterium]|nr:hypothetical protein [Eggerthellaceae bacterium]
MKEILTRDELVCMVGTDHGLASANVRSVFSLPADVREDIVALARAKLGATGVVLLATCNRTELWASFDGVEPPARSVDEHGAPQPDDPLLRVICDMHMVSPADYAQYFVCRSGDEAVNHLFHVACGLRSAIVAEDQIISQVKDSIAYSREIGVVDSVLEVLFRQAITAAKQVKSGVRFTRAYATAIEQAVGVLDEDGIDFPSTTCMVIGNGEYGRLAASTLVARGAKVFVTVRQYTHGTVSVPFGCTGVPYENRYDYLGSCRIVMSATTSPHYTLEREPFEAACVPGKRIDIFDLAIPHDIDPSIAEIAGCTVRDIDSFSTQIGTENAQAIEQAQQLLSSGMGEFWDWFARRDILSHTKTPTTVFFPLFVDLGEKRAVFIGGGTIALRRIRTLLPFVGELVVYAPDFSPELENLAESSLIELVREPYRESMLDEADIAFACTNSADINDEVWAACKRRGILVNVCSDRNKCDFYFPGIAQRGNMVVGISAGGKDHRRVRQLKARIEMLMEEEDV